MEKLRLTSIRLEPEILRRIDNLAAKTAGFKRSSLINQILHAVVCCTEPDVLWRMISTWNPEKSGYTVDFRVDKNKLANLPHVD